MVVSYLRRRYHPQATAHLSFAANGCRNVSIVKSLMTAELRSLTLLLPRRIWLKLINISFPFFPCSTLTCRDRHLFCRHIGSWRQGSSPRRIPCQTCAHSCTCACPIKCALHHSSTLHQYLIHFSPGCSYFTASLMRRPWPGRPIWSVKHYRE